MSESTQETVCIIPARGGSKRIPRKNIRDFFGRPIIAWSIEKARESGLFSRIIVSTDSEEVAAIAREHGAEVPFRRPASLSDDFTPIVPIVRHALDCMEKETGGASIRHACCLFATAPFVTVSSLQKAYEILSSHSDTDFVFAATTFPFPIFRAVRATESGRVEMFWPEHELTRSQDLPTAFHDAGQFFWGIPKAFREYDGIFNARTRMVVLPRHCVQDLDTEEDWDRAVAMAPQLMSNRSTGTSQS